MSRNSYTVACMKFMEYRDLWLRLVTSHNQLARVQILTLSGIYFTWLNVG